MTLISLYLSSISTIVFAIVANYIELLLSRALLWFSIGLNFAVHCVMIAQLISNKAFLDDIVIISSLMYSVGGAWFTSVLGYLLLDVVGWRIFILLTSLPFFIPPIIMLHLCFAGKSGANVEQIEIETVPLPKSIFVARTTKLGVYCTINTIQCWLTILMVDPAS